MSPLSEYRKEKDRYFATGAQSPLTPEQKQAFTGLNYFPENAALRLELPLEEFETKEEIIMPTSTGSEQHYTRYGKIRFEVEGKFAELVVYEGDHGFFLPFVDSLANKETYGAGRYLEPEYVGGDKVLVDFNLAYNPYCAYNDRWSCPLTPFENRLKLPIRAGEKIFK